MDQWLVRTAQNWIAGPYTRTQVCDLVKQGKLSIQDEVCPANGYWFYLHEREEVLSQLGIEVPRQKKARADDEVTETQTEVLEEDTAPGSGDDAELPELADEAFDQTDQTAMIHNRNFRRNQGSSIQKAAGPSISQALQHATLKSQSLYQARGIPVEKLQLKKGFAFALLILTAGIAFFVLRRLS